MLINPGVQVKAVEGNAVTSNRDYGQVGTYLSFEDSSANRAVRWRVTYAN